MFDVFFGLPRLFPFSAWSIGCLGLREIVNVQNKSWIVCVHACVAVGLGFATTPFDSLVCFGLMCVCVCVGFHGKAHTTRSYWKLSLVCVLYGEVILNMLASGLVYHLTFSWLQLCISRVVS